MYVCKKTNGSTTNFLVMYVSDIQYFENVVQILLSINDMLITKVFMKKIWMQHPICLASIVIDVSGC